MSDERRKPDSEGAAERAAERTFAAKTESHEHQQLMSSTLEQNSQIEGSVGYSNVGESVRDDLELPIQDHDIALDENNNLTNEGRMKLRALEDHECIEAFLTAPAPCLREFFGSPEDDPSDGAYVSKITFSVGDSEVELDASPYIDRVKNTVLFTKVSQMTLEEFHQRYVSRMSNSELFNFDDKKMVATCCRQGLPFKVGLGNSNEAFIESVFQRVFKEPLGEFLDKFIEVDKDKVSKDYLDYLPRIAKSLEESKPRGTAPADVLLWFPSQTSLRLLGLNCLTDHSLGCSCLVGSGNSGINSQRATITPMVLGETKCPYHELQTGYTWLVDNDGETSLNETMPTPVDNFKEVSDKLISQSIHVNARKCFITTYDYLFLFELEIDKTTKLLKCRHIMFPTTETKAVKFYFLSFLMHDKDDWLKDREFRDHKHLIPNILHEPPEQPEESMSHKFNPPSSASSRPSSTTSTRTAPSALCMPPPPNAESVNHEQHGYDSLEWNECSNSKSNYLEYWIIRMANKQKIPTRKYLMSSMSFDDSQVLEVNKDIFAHIEPSNRLIDLCDAVDGILKVVDPAWIEYELGDKVLKYRGRLLSMRYQKAVESIYNELEIYQRISEKQIAPRVLALGILEDPVSSETGPRFQGPFFILEKIEMHEKLWVEFTEEELSHHFVKVRERFQALWDCNIVHGDIAFRNIILDKNEDVKLIEFGSSSFTEDPKEFERELKCLERLFSIE